MAGARQRIAHTRLAFHRRAQRRLRWAKMCGLLFMIAICAATVLGWVVPLVEDLRHPRDSRGAFRLPDEPTALREERAEVEPAP